MRYGTLLGQEFESGLPRDVDTARDSGHDGEPDAEHAVEHEAAADALASVPAEFTHQHDAADSARFFSTDVKASMKRALAAMWEAEGKLRTIQPRAALPDENLALRILKQVQQRSRVFVNKVGFEAAALHPDEDRLSGDLSQLKDREASLTANDDSELDAMLLAMRALDSTT